MSKKKTKKGIKKIKKDYQYLLKNVDEKSKKNLNNDLKRALKDIEKMQLSLYEVDKKYDSKNRRKINKDEKEFYTSMEQIRHRKKMCKQWEDRGFLDEMIDLLNEVSPMIKLLAKALAALIVTFLSIDGIKKVIKPTTLRKITHIFDIAMAM